MSEIAEHKTDVAMYSSRKEIRLLTVAAQLARIPALADNISLEAMNARTIVSRMGREADAFHPLTDYLYRMAHDVINLAKEIAEQSQETARFSLEMVKATDRFSRIEKGAKLARRATYFNSLKEPLLDGERVANDLARDESHRLYALYLQVDDIGRYLVAAETVMSLTRLEASRFAPKQRQSLENLANKLKVNVDEIRSIVNQTSTMLRQ